MNFFLFIMTTLVISNCTHQENVETWGINEIKKENLLKDTISGLKFPNNFPQKFTLKKCEFDKEPSFCLRAEEQRLRTFMCVLSCNEVVEKCKVGSTKDKDLPLFERNIICFKIKLEVKKIKYESPGKVTRETITYPLVKIWNSLIEDPETIDWREPDKGELKEWGVKVEVND